MNLQVKSLPVDTEWTAKIAEIGRKYFGGFRKNHGFDTLRTGRLSHFGSGQTFLHQQRRHSSVDVRKQENCRQ